MGFGEDAVLIGRPALAECTSHVRLLADTYTLSSQLIYANS